jgi:hypothetical protein
MALPESPLSSKGQLAPPTVSLGFSEERANAPKVSEFLQWILCDAAQGSSLGVG